MKKFITLLLALLLVFGLAACGGGGTTETPPPAPTADVPAETTPAPEEPEERHTVRVGLVGAFNVHWDLIQEIVAEEGIDLELVFFSDFMTPNLALDGGDIDLNAFQHRMFLANDSGANGYEIEEIAETFIAPLNIFNNPDRISSLEDLQDGHTIAIPSDPTNSGRALRLLEAAGLIVLDTPDGEIPSVLDISEHIVNINILEAESGMLFNILPDVEAAIINATNAFTAGLRPEEDSIFQEDVTGDNVAQLVNIIVARTADVQEGGLRAQLFEIIVRAHHSDAVRQLLLDDYQGALIPVW
ncbi:MAG: MetQ/NlpA family ABC transporter substrate-binding protein [Oscillospiraceae bacterium]|nr:MetQ/NlpA family ABC transporter substrate-binding protein [Oscillospiraceae bacterium]